jgi:hypothetical protein
MKKSLPVGTNFIAAAALVVSAVIFILGGKPSRWNRGI